MPLMSHGNAGKYLSEEWHEIRRIAHEETYDIDDWSNIDQTRFDLDDVDFDRKKVDRAFVTEEAVHAEGAAHSGTDIRTLDTIRD